MFANNLSILTDEDIFAIDRVYAGMATSPAAIETGGLDLVSAAGSLVK